jgi:hypothetical protein
VRLIWRSPACPTDLVDGSDTVCEYARRSAVIAVKQKSKIKEIILNGKVVFKLLINIG